MDEAGLGFAPHSGWAVVVGVSEVEGVFRVLIRERIEIADARAPESKQPYHAVEGLPIDEAAQRLGAWAATAERLAADGIRGIIERLGRGGYRAVGVGVMQSAGRKGKALADTLASHALIHSADGDHFRTAIAEAAARCGLAAVGVPARDLMSRAESATGRSARALDGLLKAAGRELGPPWGADQKSAAILAWLVLRQPPSRGRRAKR